MIELAALLMRWPGFAHANSFAAHESYRDPA